MHHALRRDRRRRRALRRTEVTRLVWKTLRLTGPGPSALRAQDALSTLGGAGSAGRLRNRCLWTGRGRGVLRAFRLSRMALRDLAARGWLPGLHRASG
uniref:Ribosomal protein S14 n=1 Tax=Picocystis salinarum TaxID=88271 RepID=A0A4D6C4C8_9CHLO|nr:ribosomal protein S14 [Picocystis salinarum]QBX98541.1 ribosomal protein S14 [Picocystis salinarum]